MLSNAQALSLASPALIDSQQVVRAFINLLQPKNQYRLLGISGPTMTGKSHLLFQVFPELAQQHTSAGVAVLDPQSASPKVSYLLKNVARQLGGPLLENFENASQTWLVRPKVLIHDSKTIFTKFNISVPITDAIDADDSDEYLTTAFVQAIELQPNDLILVLVDRIDEFDDNLQSWLLTAFLPQLATLPQVRIVLAGRTLPQLGGVLLARTLSVGLAKVRQIEDYLLYSRLQHPTIKETVVVALAQASGYFPGTFVQLATTYEHEERSNR